MGKDIDLVGLFVNEYKSMKKINKIIYIFLLVYYMDFVYVWFGGFFFFDWFEDSNRILRLEIGW